MKTRFSKTWNSSVQPRKQRKYRYNAPLHIKGKFLSISLSKELRKKYNKRSLRARVGDKVKVLRGQFKGKEGTIEKVLLKKSKVQINGAENIKKDGSKSFYPISPSNVMIIELKLDDKKREAALKRKDNKEKTETNKAEVKK